VEDAKPILFVECKWSDDEVSRSLYYLHQRFPDVPAWQIHADGEKNYQTPEKIRVAPAHVFLRQLI
jgi:hypothetical protein